MYELPADRGCNDRSRRIVGCGSTDPQSAGGVGAETSQETLDSANGLEGLEVLEVEEGCEVTRLEDEGGGVNEFDLMLVLVLRVVGVDGRARVGWCGRAEGVSGESDGGSRVGHAVGSRAKQMIMIAKGWETKEGWMWGSLSI